LLYLSFESPATSKIKSRNSNDAPIALV